MTFLVPEDEGAGDINAGVGAGDNSDEEGKGEVIHRAATKDEEGQGGEEYGAGGDQRSPQGLIQRTVDNLTSKNSVSSGGVEEIAGFRAFLITLSFE